MGFAAGFGFTTGTGLSFPEARALAARAAFFAWAAASFFSRARVSASFSMTASLADSSFSVTIVAWGRRLTTASIRSAGMRSRKRAASLVSRALDT